MKILKFLGVLILYFGVFASCEKKPNHFFWFNREGGPVEYYDVDIDGSTLKIQIGESLYSPLYFTASDLIEDDSHWAADIDWILVSYTPSKKWLHIIADPNTTGAVRYATIYGYNEKGKVSVEIKQSE